MDAQNLVPAGSQEVRIDGQIATIKGRAFNVKQGMTSEKYETDQDGNQVVIPAKKYLRFNVSYPERTLVGDEVQIIFKRVNVTAWEEQAECVELQELASGQNVTVTGWLRRNQPWIDRQGLKRFSDNLTLQGIVL